LLFINGHPFDFPESLNDFECLAHFNLNISLQMKTARATEEEQILEAASQMQLAPRARYLMRRHRLELSGL
jgi:hypothetical protein